MHNLLLATISEKDRLKKSREKVATPFSSLKPYGSCLLPRKPEFCSDLAQNLIQIPYLNDAFDNIL